jgi:carbamoyl-phosphate synthase large subunit
LVIVPVYKKVDTCAAEFDSVKLPICIQHMIPALDDSGNRECESNPTEKEKVVIIGGGPNRIGQGIEFDYCCCQASYALSEIGYETIMINCNPETVSTDYDTSDRLYFEPLIEEYVLEILKKRKF